MSEYSSRSNCSRTECFPEKSSWCWNEQVCQRMKHKVLSVYTYFLFTARYQKCVTLDLRMLCHHVAAMLFR